MTYDTKNKVLYTGVREKINITGIEHKILICLSSGDLRKYEEISQYIYETSDKYTKKNISIHVSILRNKTKKQLKITAVRGRGFRLDNEIYFK